jgi:S1-C subfamily serine protease
MKRCRLLAACLGLWATPGDAATWWWLGDYGGMGPTRHERYLDGESVRKKSGGLVEAWTIDVTASPNKANGSSWSRTFQRFDCRNRTATPLSISAYTERGVLIGTANFDQPQTAPVAAETAGDAALRFACKQGQVSADVVPDPVAHAFAYFKVPVAGQALASAPVSTPAAEPAQAAAAGEAAAAGSIGNGTGFFVNGSGEVVTCYHVIKGATAILVVAADGSSHRAELVRASPATDLAVLAVDYRSSRYLTLAPPGRARPGDHVFTFGFPVMEVLGSEAKYTDGAISSLSGIGDEASMAQISIPVQPGNSGGPVVNDRGEVVGVIDAGADVDAYVQASGTLPQNVNWAVRGDYVLPLIRSAPPIPVHSRQEAIALARDAVVLVWVKH